MLVFAGVAARRDRDFRTDEWGAGGEAGESLQRLDRRARKDLGIGVAEGEHDLAVGVEGDQRAEVTALDQAGAPHGGELDQG